MLNIPSSLLLIALLLLPSCEKPQQAKKNQNTKNQLEAELSDIRKTSRRDILENPEALNNHTEKIRDAYAKAEKNSSGDQAIMTGIGRQFTEIVAKDNQLINEAISKLTQSIDYSDVKTKQDLANKTKLLNEFKTTNEYLIQKIKTGWSTQLRQILSEANISQKKRDDFFNGFTIAMERQKPLALEIRDYDQIICGEVIKQHQILEREWGKWHWENDEITFASDAAIDEFNQTLERFDELGTKQENAQRKLLSQ